MEDSKHLLACIGGKLLGIPGVGDWLSLLGITEGILSKGVELRETDPYCRRM
jgi:hypothetical protein